MKVSDFNSNPYFRGVCFLFLLVYRPFIDFSLFDAFFECKIVGGAIIVFQWKFDGFQIPIASNPFSGMP